MGSASAMCPKCPAQLVTWWPQVVHTTPFILVPRRRSKTPLTTGSLEETLYRLGLLSSATERRNASELFNNPNWIPALQDLMMRVRIEDNTSKNEKTQELSHNTLFVQDHWSQTCHEWHAYIGVTMRSQASFETACSNQKTRFVFTNLHALWAKLRGKRKRSV
jgi:hypothetical protein